MTPSGGSMQESFEDIAIDGVELAELIIRFTDECNNINIFFETNKGLLILNSAESLINRAKQKGLIKHQT